MMKHANPVTVDERFELVALVFRLANRSYYNDEKTEYQKELASVFATHKDHPAVAFACTCSLHFDIIFSYACHLIKQKGVFALIDNLSELTREERGHWTHKTAEEFLPLLNDFYRDTNFSEFFQAHTAFYEKSAAQFAKKYYSKIDLEWFRPHIDPVKLHCVLGLSSCGYGALANGEAYVAVSEKLAAKHPDLILLVYCLPFAWPLANEWYAQNPDFKKLCDWDIVKGASVKIMARNYVAYAYVILYEVQHGGKLNKLLRKYEKQVLSQIKQVYEMIASP